MNNIEKDLLLAVADLHQIPSGAFSLRENGKSVDVKNTTNINIVPKKDKSGIDIYIAPNTKNESLHMPVIITKSGIKDAVYNDFYIGENAEVLIVAGCGIHNTESKGSEHNGIHSFHLSKGAKVKYVEKHIGTGNGGDKILNPVTKIYLEENAELELDTVQLGGVTSSIRESFAELKDNSKLIIKEKILTNDSQYAKTNFDVKLIGKDSSVDVVSRSVAKGESKQEFYSRVTGLNKCFGHVECDAIIMDKGKVVSTPEIVAEDVDATLIHEAAVGKIAGEQLTKLMTLGLNEKEAEDMIIKGFLS
jgi:Fe-S cluster assembly scaffold protein SufB